MQEPCSICGKPSSHKVVKIQSGQLEETYYCAEHAPGGKNFAAQTHLQVSLEELLNSLLSQAHSDPANSSGASISDFKCGVCNLPFSLYRKTMILGCDRCYESFSAQLELDLRKFHGATKHVGRRPPHFVPNPEPAKAQMIVQKHEEPAHEPPAQEASAPSSESLPLPVQPKFLDPKQRLERLRKDMLMAVDREDFEKAARLRDLINELQKELSGPNGD